MKIWRLHTQMAQTLEAASLPGQLSNSTYLTCPSTTGSKIASSRSWYSKPSRACGLSMCAIVISALRRRSAVIGARPLHLLCGLVGVLACVPPNGLSLHRMDHAQAGDLRFEARVHTCFFLTVALKLADRHTRIHGCPVISAG